MSAPELNEDFQDVLDAFRDAGVEFIVVGAHALAVHGIVRATGDLDIFVRPSRENALRVVAALQAFGAPLQLHGVSTTDFETPDVVYQLGLPPRRIDVLTSITGVPFERAWATKIGVDVGERRLFFLGHEALLANKRATGRAKDLADVQALEKLVMSEVEK